MVDLDDDIEISEADTKPIAATSRIVDPRSIPWRFSRLKKMDASPLQYWQSCQSIDDKPTLAMRLGSGAHAIVLGQPVAIYDGVRNGKRWKAFEAEAKEAGKVVVNVREHAESSALASAILRHKLASELLLADDVVRERQIDWWIRGRNVTSRPDAFGPNHVADLKTDRNANPEDFQRTAWKMFYPAQLAFYREAIGTIGHIPENAYLVAVEKKPPYDISVHQLTDEVMKLSWKTIAEWIDRLLECEDLNEWPGYGAAAFTFDVPTRKPWELSAFEDDVEFQEEPPCES